MTATPQRVAAPRGLSHVDVASAVRGVLRNYATQQAHAAGRYGPDFRHLWNVAAQTMLGGKFIRPVLLVEVATAFQRAGSGRIAVDEDTVMSAAAAVELLHYSFVLHDDVIDGDVVRRGRPNLIGTVAAQHPTQLAPSRLVSQGDHGATALHWGTSSAILMGDLLLSGVYQSFARLDAPTAMRQRLFDLLGHTIDETVAGEFADVGLGDGCLAPELGAILEMSANKTATYTFEFPLRMAAILCGAGGDVEERLAIAGRHLGLAFQLQDDLLSVFGDPSRHGKDANSDLREGKQTALIAYARMTGAWKHIEPLLGRSNLSAADADQIRMRLAACGARAYVEGLIDDSLAAFHRAVLDRDVDIPAEVRAVLVETAERLGRRES